MLYSLFGKLIIKKPQFIVVETNGLGFGVFISSKTSKGLPKINSKIRLFCSLIMRQENPEIYGFLSQEELEIFELLNNIPSVGPKSALGILGAFKIEKFLAAISQGRADLLSKSWGIGRKKAQRIILELKDKLKDKIENKSTKEILPLMETEREVESILKDLGYRQSEIKAAIDHLPEKTKKLEDCLKLALRFLARNK